MNPRGNSLGVLFVSVVLCVVLTIKYTTNLNDLSCIFNGADDGNRTIYNSFLRILSMFIVCYMMLIKSVLYLPITKALRH